MNTSNNLLVGVILLGLAVPSEGQETVFFSPGAVYLNATPDGTLTNPYDRFSDAVDQAGEGRIVLMGNVYRDTNDEPLILTGPITLSAASGADSQGTPYAPVSVGLPEHRLTRALKGQNPTGAYGSGGFDFPLDAIDQGAHVNGMAVTGNTFWVNWPDYEPDWSSSGPNNGPSGWLIRAGNPGVDSWTWYPVDISENDTYADGKPDHMDGAEGGGHSLVACSMANGNVRIYEGAAELETMRIDNGDGGQSSVGLAYHPDWQRFILLSMSGNQISLYAARYNEPWLLIKSPGEIRWDGQWNSRLDKGEAGTPFFHIQGNEFGILSLGVSPTANDDKFSFRATRVWIDRNVEEILPNIPLITYEATFSILPDFYTVTPPAAQSDGPFGFIDPSPNFRWAGTAQMRNGQLELFAAGRPRYLLVPTSPIGYEFSKWVYTPNIVD